MRFICLSLYQYVFWLILCGAVCFIPAQLSAQQKKQTAAKKNKTVRSEQDIYIDNLLKKMTLQEKLGQLNLLPVSGEIITGQAEASDIGPKIRDGLVGGLFNVKSVEKITELQQLAVEKSRLGIPLLFGMDVIHGYETVFPVPLALAASWDMDLIEKTSRIAATEASADGINWVFSPMVDICRDPRWGRIVEGPGEDPYLASAIARRMVKGYQGELKTAYEVLACVKHYALYGAAESGRDYNTTDMSLSRMFNVYMPPYKAAVDAGVGSVMASFNDVNGVPATANRFLMTEVLRDMWGFKGFVVSDYTGVNELIAHGLGDLQQVSALALQAGIDMDMVGEGFLTTLEQSLATGKVSIHEIDNACRGVLNAKYRLGLFKDPYKYCNINRARNEIFTPSNRAYARKAAAESCVLLKNDNQLLPLLKKGKIALIGPMADNKENMVGSWSVAADFSKAISLYTGLKEAVAGRAEILYARGSWFDYDSLYELRVGIFGKPVPRDGRPLATLRNEALKVAAEADVIIAALGEAAEMSGESSSRTDIRIPQSQQDLLKALVSTGKPVVLVLFNGRPLDLSWEGQNVTAILNTWFGGTEAGHGIADVLFGDVNPSGKLPVTFPQNIGQIPIYYAQNNTGRPLDKGKWFEKFKSNYLDVSNEPLYAFGYGLSYTTFTYSDLRIVPDSREYGKVEVSVNVTNSGSLAGSEVVQLYIRDMVAGMTRPVQELKGFEKIMLAPGESKQVSFTLRLDDFRYYTNELKWVYEPGDFMIMTGGSSDKVLQGKYTLPAKAK